MSSDSQLQPAGLPRRIVALLIDALPALLFVVVFYAVGIFESDIFMPPDEWFWTEWLLEAWLENPGQFIIPGATFVVLATATTFSVEALSGTSLGGRVLGLRVVDRGGFDAGGWQTLWRAIGALLNIASLGLGYLWILVSRYRRGWHDLLSSTVVVHD